MDRRNHWKVIALFIVLITTASAFTVEGDWALEGSSGIDTNGSVITLTISDVVYRNQTILQKLSFKGCEEMLLQAQMVENQLFINFNSYMTQPIPGVTCQSKTNNPLTTIFSRLNRVFYFEINIDTLILNDPYGSTQLSFKRIIPKRTVDLSGVWSMNQFGNTRTALSV